MTDHQTLHDLYDALDPSSLSTDQLLTYTLVGEVIGLRADVIVEREDRKESFRLMRAALRTAVIGILAIVLVLAGGAVAWVRANQITCGTRNNSRADSRAMSIAVADNTVKELDRNKVVDRGDLAESNQRVALEQYPPLDC